MNNVMVVEKPHVLSAKVIREAEKHLRRSCKIMAGLVTRHGSCQLVHRKTSPFYTLAISIISQQLSKKAAQTIRNRVMDIVPTFSPDCFMDISIDTLRSTGLSSAKARYILELAKRVNDGRLNFDEIVQLSDEDAIGTLIDLPGIGRWTAEMFLIFGLKRPDVLALGDAGLQRSARLLYGESVQLENLGQLWRPFRSVASWYLWRHLDAPNAVLAKKS